MLLPAGQVAQRLPVHCFVPNNATGSRWLWLFNSSTETAKLNSKSSVTTLKMLTRIEFQQYRCFPSLDVELRPLTVLIGPNNTGKSAFLDGIRAFDKESKLSPSDHWRLARDSTLEIRADWEFGANSSQTSNLVVKQRETNGDYSVEREVSLGEIAFFRLPSAGIKCFDEGFPESVKDLPIGDEGQHLASVLDYMLRKDRKRFDGVVATLRNLVPGFEDLAIDTPSPQSRHLHVILDNGLELPGESLSVGLRHLIFFVTLAHHPRAPQIILVEEPELGVHPKRLGDILRLLRSISQGEFCNRPAQVILTTHSPFLVDHVDLERDQLLIFQREESVEGARNAYPADKQRLQVFLDEFMLGEVWFNEGEVGLIQR